jgi:hypothetical protein
VITQQPPSSVTAGTGFGLTVQAEDSLGNLVSSFSGTVTVGLASNPGGTMLGGTLTVAASGGVATFSGLTLTTAGSGYTLYVSASGPTSTTTSAITVTSAGNAVMAARASQVGWATPTIRSYNVVDNAHPTTVAAPPAPALVPLVLDDHDFLTGLLAGRRRRRT